MPALSVIVGVIFESTPSVLALLKVEVFQQVAYLFSPLAECFVFFLGEAGGVVMYKLDLCVFSARIHSREIKRV